jgi:uncharacterized membrane protein
MSLSQVHYLPLAPPFFFILVGLFVALLVLIQLGVLRYAYMRLGISSGAALLLLLASLIGSYFNIPVAYLPEQQVLAQQEIDFFGVRYVVPFVAQWPGTLIAVNVGGAVCCSLDGGSESVGDPVASAPAILRRCSNLSNMLAVGAPACRQHLSDRMS